MGAERREVDRLLRAVRRVLRLDLARFPRSRPRRSRAGRRGGGRGGGRRGTGVKTSRGFSRRMTSMTASSSSRPRRRPPSPRSSASRNSAPRISAAPLASRRADLRPSRACPSRPASGPRCRSGSPRRFKRASVPPHVSSTSSGCAAMARTSTGMRSSPASAFRGPTTAAPCGEPLPADRRRRSASSTSLPEGEHRRERRIDALGGNASGMEQRAARRFRRFVVTSPFRSAALRGALGELLELVGDLLRRVLERAGRAWRPAARARPETLREALRRRLREARRARPPAGTGCRSGSRPAAQQILVRDAELLGEAPLRRGPAATTCVRGMSTGGGDPEEAEERKALGVVRDLRRPENARRHGEEIRLQDRPGYDVRRGQRLAGARRARPRPPRPSTAPAARRASIRKKENPSGSGAGTGLPARSQLLHGLAPASPASASAFSRGLEEERDGRRAQRARTAGPGRAEDRAPRDRAASR